MKTTNYTDLRANLKGYIDSVIDDCDTVFRVSGFPRLASFLLSV